ncbi:MAG: bifunctional hydroxymethylpyrimidine kinase/phosphomethylpyrimidine kinase [Candidatus Methanomethylicia archaeon]
MKIYKALTIAGSDSSGGAGIQADLKTFSAFQVYGMTVITALTAQNTMTVKGIHPIPPEFIKLQFEAVVEDIGVDAAKTGMLYSEEIIDIVAEEISIRKIPLIVDPVMIAKSKAKLLKDEAIKALKEKLIPIAKIVTPNIPEAEEMVKHKIKGLEDMKKAAIDIKSMGVEAVIIKGGHLEGEKVIDLLYYDDSFYENEKRRIETKKTHGTGCVFSAALTALIARKVSIPEAFRIASEFMDKSIIEGLNIGRGYGPVNPMAKLYEEANRYNAWINVLKALEKIEETKELAELIPEVRMNIGEAIPNAKSIKDVCAIDGRITVVNGFPRANGQVKFGASKHIANVILSAMEIDPNMRAAMNIKYSEEILEACRRAGFKIAEFKRKEEPLEIKLIEGGTLKWGVKKAIEDLGETPDVIYDLGEIGKEAMIRIIGINAEDVVNKATKIIKKLRI